MGAVLRELTNELLETSGELVKCISGGDYSRALRCRRRLDKIAEQAAQLLSTGKPTAPALLEYRAALTKANKTLAQARINAHVERDRIGRAIRHCGSVKNWMETNQTTLRF
jgi:hypothetical protein